VHIVKLLDNIIGRIEQDRQIINRLSSVLISPIKRDKHISGSDKKRIQILPARIISTSTIYYSNKDWDEDMSDIAIRFYEKVFPTLYDENNHMSAIR
jgi:hypothetical protein